MNQGIKEKRAEGTACAKACYTKELGANEGRKED